MPAPRMRPARAIALLALLAGACAAPGGAAPTAARLPTQPPATARPPTEPPPPTAAPTPAPSPTPAPGLAVTGDPEIVFDWTTGRCEDEDIPDLPARAFRDDRGRVNLIATHLETRRFLGPALEGVTRDCAVVMRSNFNPDPAQFDDNRWLAAPYTLDGETIYGLAHHEYQGHQHPGWCASGEYFPCWYNAVTLVVSRDGGESYASALEPPAHLAAALPVQYEDGAGPYGVFEPSNIVDGGDGHYYALLRVDEYRSDEQGICLMRTPDLADPAAWRAWDGADFTTRFANPYAASSSPEARRCAFLDPGGMGVMNQSLTWSTYLNRWLLVGSTAIHLEGREIWGVLYALSDDLIHWDTRRLLFEAEFPWTWQPGDADPILYPALLDPASEARNFETSGASAYVYYTRFNNAEGAGPLDRDLLRVPVAWR